MEQRLALPLPQAPHTTNDTNEGCAFHSVIVLASRYHGRYGAYISVYFRLIFGSLFGFWSLPCKFNNYATL